MINMTFYKDNKNKNETTRLPDTEIEAALDQLSLSEIIARMIYPPPNEGGLYEEIKQELNLYYIQRKRPLLIEEIEKKNFDCSVTSHIRSLLSLPDEQYITDNRHNRKITLHAILTTVTKNMKTDYLRVFILLMELLDQEEGKVSLDEVEHGLLNKPRKGNFILKTLKGYSFYSRNYKKYKGVSHFILALYVVLVFPHLLLVEEIDQELTYEALAERWNIAFFCLLQTKMSENKERYKEELISRGDTYFIINPHNEGSLLLMFKYINYFKERLLKLNNKHNKNKDKNLFKETDFFKLSQENPYTFSTEEVEKLEKRISFIWKAMRKWLLTKNEILCVLLRTMSQCTQ